jgi:hypothetical protein
VALCGWGSRGKLQDELPKNDKAMADRVDEIWRHVMAKTDLDVGVIGLVPDGAHYPLHWARLLLGSATKVAITPRRLGHETYGTCGAKFRDK